MRVVKPELEPNYSGIRTDCNRLLTVRIQNSLPLISFDPLVLVSSLTMLLRISYPVLLNSFQILFAVMCRV